MKKYIACMIALMMIAISFTALADDTITFDGTIVSLQTHTLNSNIGGTAVEVLVQAGDRINAGDTIARVEAEKVYAQQDGIVYIFGEPGDSIDQITTRYGSPAYIEPSYTYTISGSTSTAYDLEENRLIHPGEMVYLRGYNYTTHQGVGQVTTVSGTSFTVEVISGNFDSSESVNIYRSSDYTSKSRIGKGKTTRVDPIAYTGTGSLVAWHVENGQSVKKGDLLFETVEGSFQPGENVSCAITAKDSGIITAVNIAPGTALTSGAAVVSFYPDSDMMVEASVYEGDLSSIQPGDQVTVEFAYADNNADPMTGTIERISYLAASSDAEGDAEAASYTIYIRLSNPANVRYGMHVLVTPNRK